MTGSDGADDAAFLKGADPDAQGASATGAQSIKCEAYFLMRIKGS